MFPDVFRHDRRNLPVWDSITEEIGPEPLPESFPDTPEGIEEFERANDSYRRLISRPKNSRILQSRGLRRHSERPV